MKIWERYPYLGYTDGVRRFRGDEEGYHAALVEFFQENIFQKTYHDFAARDFGLFRSDVLVLLEIADYLCMFRLYYLTVELACQLYSSGETNDFRGGLKALADVYQGTCKLVSCFDKKKMYIIRERRA